MPMLLNDDDFVAASSRLLFASSAVRCYASNPCRSFAMSSVGCVDKMKERRTVGERRGVPQQMSRFRTPSRESVGCLASVSVFSVFNRDVVNFPLCIMTSLIKLMLIVVPEEFFSFSPDVSSCKILRDIFNSSKIIAGTTTRTMTVLLLLLLLKFFCFSVISLLVFCICFVLFIIVLLLLYLLPLLLPLLLQ